MTCSLKNVCDIFDFVNLVKSPTCFTKGAPATLNDVILTNRSTLCQNIQNFNCGLSDVHNIISVQIKGTIPRIIKNYLEQKNLNSIVDKCDNVNSAYENLESELISMKKKKKKPVDKPVPFMNKNLKRAIYKKRMSFNKYNRCKNKQNWEIYRKQRNLVNKIKKTIHQKLFY